MLSFTCETSLISLYVVYQPLSGPAPVPVPPESPPTGHGPLDRGRGGEAVPLGQLAGDIGLGPDQEPPPPDVVHVVVASLGLEAGVVGQGVVGPPDPAGDPVGHQAVDAVVA